MKTVFDYKNELNELTFTDAQKAAMTERLLQAAAPSAEKPRRRFTKRSIVAVAAAAACLCAVAGAAGIPKVVSDVFAPVFGTAETEIIDKIGHPIGASATAGGVTITADAILGDKYHYAVVYSLEKTDGTAFDLEEIGTVGDNLLNLSFGQSDLLTGILSGGHGVSYFYDADPNDNAIQYTVAYESNEALPVGGSAKAMFKDLYYYPGSDYENRQLLAKGNWKLTFAMDFEDASLSLPAGQKTTLNGMDVTIDAITLSPLALRVDYTVDSLIPRAENAADGRETAAQSAIRDKYFGDLEITVVMKDGSAFTMDGSGGHIARDDGAGIARCQKGSVFERIIDLNDVASIVVEDVTIPVELS